MAVMKEKERLAEEESRREAAPSTSQPATQPLSPGGFDNDDANSEALVTDGFSLPDLEVNDDAPPAYGEHRDEVQFSQPGFEAGAKVTDDGRVNININTKNRRLADLLAPAIAHQASAAAQPPLPPAYIPPSLGGQPDQTPPPQLNVVVQIVGSRGDVQPFVALGKVLRDTYGHRVRIATHTTFQGFVEENGLEFFNIGGDPAELMAFMVKNPGLMPGFDALKSGEVSKRRKGIEEMLLGCWRSCVETGNGLGPPPRPHNKDQPLDINQGMPGDHSQEPFVADAIIANPPSFAHIHVAEKLGIPLHVMFTMPWSPTRAFPHPLANVQSSNADDVLTNFLTYTLVEMMTWQGLGDVINRFREKALELPPLSLIWAPGLLNRLRIPYTYCWSPALIPKPNDWGANIDISGFYFLNLASAYTPDPELAAFLEAGPPPVYIGFGSIVVDDPNAMTNMIFEAIRATGVRALVSKGWGGLGADDLGIPEGVHMLGNVPHDWLFEHVSAVVHHGGAGTTAAGIKAGKPTTVCCFFGDQPFWGAMISRAKAGPDPIPYKELTAEKLAAAIKFCIQPDTLERAEELGRKIKEEKGTDVGGQSFHSHLDMESLRCSIAPSRTAAWRVRRSQVKLSALAATVLVEEGLLQYSDLKLHRSIEYNTEDQPPDPISAGATSIIADISSIGMGIADMPRELFKKSSRKRQSEETISASETNLAREARRMSTSQSGNASSTNLEETGSRTDSISTKEPLSLQSTRSFASQAEQSEKGKESSDAASVMTSSSGTTGALHSRSSSAQRKQSGSGQQPSPSNRFTAETAIGTGKGVHRIVTTGVKSPMNFCLGCAKGFRNIPRLYNDDTVRPVEKVTDLGSGIRIAGKEFGYGLFDGISGLVTQPLRGAEKSGAEGLVKGFGKGIGGLITKPAAGFWGIPAYTMQGVHMQLNKMFSRSVHNYIVMSRITQGRHVMNGATTEEKNDIVNRWNHMGGALKNFETWKTKEKPQEMARADGDSISSSERSSIKPSRSWFNARNYSSDDFKSLNSARKAWKKGFVDTEVPRSSESVTSFASTAPSTSYSTSGTAATTRSSEDAEFEQAIQASVRETSRGDPEEDAKIEAAVRESVRVMREQGAYPEPIPELPEKSAGDSNIFNDEEYRITDEEYQVLIEQAIQQSMASQGDDYHGQEIGVTGGEAGPNSSSHEHDEEIRRAIEESRRPTLPPRDSNVEDNEEELQRAITASKEHMEREQSQKTEEEVVLEYIKKQSLAEEQLRRQQQSPSSAGKGKGKEGDGQDADDEELRWAMEESLKMSGGGQGSGSGSGAAGS